VLESEDATFVVVYRSNYSTALQEQMEVRRLLVMARTTCTAAELGKVSRKNLTTSKTWVYSCRYCQISLTTAHSATYLGYHTRVLAYTAMEIHLRKDAIHTVLGNQGEKAPTWTIKTQGMQFEKGKMFVDVLSCRKYGIDGDGEVDVKMEAGRPVVLVEESVLRRSLFCGHSRTDE
jgi:hypothetical protein